MASATSDGHPENLGYEMKAVVRYLHSPDAYRLESFEPENPDDLCLLIQMMVGPADGPGEESFDVVVCSPGWLAKQAAERGPIVGRHHLVVDGYDFPAIQRILVNAVESEESPTWEELGERIGRLGKWEFEDYQP